jgi:hypothetical protein
VFAKKLRTGDLMRIVEEPMPAEQSRRQLLFYCLLPTLRKHAEDRDTEAVEEFTSPNS